MMPLATSNRWDGSAHAMLCFVNMMIRGYHYLPKGSMSPPKSFTLRLELNWHQATSFILSSSCSRLLMPNVLMNR